MKVIVQFNTDNSAFEDYGFDAEVARILDKAESLVVGHGHKARKGFEVIGSLLDTNGNKVGAVCIEDDS